MNTSIMRTILSLIISSFCVELSARIAPDYIRTCPGMKSDCLKDSIQSAIPHFVKGNPSLGLNATDPMRFDYVKYDFPGGLRLEFFEGALMGPGKCVVDSVKYENNVGDFDIRCNFVIKGKYKATGKIFLVSLDGEGDAIIKAKNVITQTKIFFEDKVREGVEYHEAKTIKTDYRFGDRVSFKFTNLFKGSPELSKTILDYLNDNWKEVVDEFGRPIIDPMLMVANRVVKKFFKVVPKNEIIQI